MASEFLQVAEILFARYRKPMRPRELVNLGRQAGLFSDKIAGKTPHQTMKSKLSTHIRGHGDSSQFVRTGPGRFYLRRLLSDDKHIYHAPPLVKPTPKENVLVFPTELLAELGQFQGIKPHWKRLHARLLRGDRCSYMDRLPAEGNPSHKQVLTYVLVARGHEVLAFQRGNYTTVADFLRGAICIGFGGHVTEGDAGLFDFADMGLLSCAARELSEELALPKEDLHRLAARRGLQVVGAINDDSSLVGQRHLAFVLRYDVSNSPAWDRPRRGEKSVTRLRWIDPRDERIPIQRFEYWSQLCLRQFWGDSVAQGPSYLIRRKRPLRSPSILCVSGALGSGKSEATAVLASEFGYAEVNSGRVVAELMGRSAVKDHDRAAFQKAALELVRSDGGPRRIAEALIERAGALRSDSRVVVDGIRQPETVAELKRLAGRNRVGVIFVHTPPDLAYDLYTRREGASISAKEFAALREAPVESETEALIELSDAVLYNWTGKIEYREVVRALMSEAARGGSV